MSNTNTRHLSRSTTTSTTRTPTRTRTRTRTRNNNNNNHDKSDDEFLNFRDEPEYQRDSEAVSSSRSSTKTNRGSSRYRLKDSTKSTDKEETSRLRRPVKNNVQEDKRVTPELRTRNRNFQRASRTKLDQQTADSFNSRTKTLHGFYIVKEPSTVTPITERRLFTPSFSTELRQPSYTTTTKLYPTKPEVFEETTIPGETTHLFISVTEPTTDLVTEDETFNTVESASQTTAAPFSWSSYLSTIDDLNDELLTTLFETSTESARGKSSTIALRGSEETPKVRTRGRLTTTPTSVEDSGSRRKLIRRLRPIQEQVPTDYTNKTKTPSQRFYVRSKTTSKPESDITTLKTEVNGESGNKRKHLFQRYRGLTNQQNDVKNSEDEENDYETVTSKISRSTYREVEDELAKTQKKSRKPSKIGDFENFTSKNKATPRYNPKTTSTTESSTQETLIPTKKFDYFADAIKRATQQQRTTPVSTSKPQVTRLVTSIVESGTTERQKISIKKKYSSLTSTTYIPKSSTSSPNFLFKKRKTNQRTDLNEINPYGYSTEQSVEWSTLPIESEFVDKRFTTETSPDSSSTIEIESVFSNLIGH